MPKRAPIVIGFVIIAVLAGLVIWARHPRSVSQQEQLTTALAGYPPFIGCSATSTQIDAPADYDHAQIIRKLTCKTQTAESLSGQIIAQYTVEGYTKIGGNVPDWGCFEDSTGASKCSYSVSAQKGPLVATYYVQIPDAAAEADQNLGTKSELGSKMVSGYQLTLSFQTAATN